MKEPSFIFYIVLFVVVSVISTGVANYSEHQGYNKGMTAATTALEPYLCK